MKIEKIIKTILSLLVLTVGITVVLVLVSFVNFNDSTDKKPIAVKKAEKTVSETEKSVKTEIAVDTDEAFIAPDPEPIDIGETDDPVNPNSVTAAEASDNTPLEQARALAAATAEADGIDNKWAYWLINAKNPLPDGYKPSLSRIGSYDGSLRELDSRAAEYALLMTEAAADDGITLVPVSSYRRLETQKNNFIAEYESYVNNGMSREDAFNEAAMWIAVPNTSEHNAGIAIDFNSINESFDQTETYRWLINNSYKFGFVLRYPKDKISLTGINYEPWHYRFMGLYHAEKLHSSGVTLEEYMSGENKNDTSVLEAFKAEVINY